MHAYIRESVGGFLGGVCTLGDHARISSDPTPPCRTGIASCLYCLILRRFLPLTAANVYSLLRYLVLGNKLQGGK
jgi:hypothetical protein